MQSTSFATRCAVLMGLILLPRQGGWCHLRCPWAAALALSCHSRRAWVSHRSCLTPASLNRPLKWPRPPPMERDNHMWITEFHATHLHRHFMQLYPRRHRAPQSLGRSLLQTPTEKWVSPHEKKTLLRYRWISCILSSLLSHVPFSFLTSEEQWDSDPSLTWPSQIHLDPDCQTEISKEFVFFPFPFISPSISFLDVPFLCHISGLWSYSLTISEPGL